MIAAAVIAAAVALPAALDHPLTVTVTAPPTQQRSGQAGLPALLGRPVTLPRLRPGQSCPVTSGSEVNNAAFGGVAYGRGPVRRLVGNRTVPATGRVDLGLTGTPGLLAVETVWFATPGYDGRFVVRGRDLTTGSPIPIGNASGPAPGPLEIPAGPTANTTDGYRTVPGATWVTTPGCYGWQVDDPDFTTTIVLDLLAGQLHGQIDAVGCTPGATSTALPGTVRIWGAQSKDRRPSASRSQANTPSPSSSHRAPTPSPRPAPTTTTARSPAWHLRLSPSTTQSGSTSP